MSVLVISSFSLEDHLDTSEHAYYDLLTVKYFMKFYSLSTVCYLLELTRYLKPYVLIIYLGILSFPPPDPACWVVQHGL